MFKAKFNETSKKTEISLKFNEFWTALLLGVAQVIQKIKHWTLNLEKLE